MLLKNTQLKNWILTAIFFAVSAALIYFKFAYDRSQQPENISLPSNYTIAVWKWDFEAIQNFQTELNMLKNQGVNEVFLDITRYLDLYEIGDLPDRSAKLEGYTEAIKSYNTEAKNLGIKVQAVAGSPKWINDTLSYLPQDIIKFVSEFNRENPEIAFSGLQFDIEPHTLADFDQYKGEYLGSFLAVVKKLSAQIIEYQDQSLLRPDFKYGLVIPHWYNQREGRIGLFSWEGSDRTVFEHLASVMTKHENPYFVIMAYNNSAETAIRFSSSFFPLVEGSRMNILVGQETSNVPPETSTYFGKKLVDFKKSEQKIIQELKQNDNFVGIAINNSTSFLLLKTK